MRYLRGLGQAKQPADAEEPKSKELKPPLTSGPVPYQPRPAALPDHPTSAAGLVDAAVAAFTLHGWPTENDLRGLPAVERILSAPDPVRAEAIRIVARGNATRAGSIPGRLDPTGTCMARLLPVVARKRVQLGLDELLGILADLAPNSTQQAVWCQRAIEDLSGQIEFNASRLDADERRRFDDAGRGFLAAFPRASFYAKELWRLRTLVASEGFSLDEVSDRDAVGMAFREVLGATDVSDPADVPFVKLLIAPTKAGGKPPAAWAKQIPAVAASAPSGGRLVSALLKSAVDAPDTDVLRYEREGHPYTYRRFVTDANEGLLLNVVWTAAMLRNHANIPLLRDLAVKCTQVVPESGSLRSLTTSNACAHAIAEIGGGEALTALRTLELTVKHGAFVKEVGKAIRSLASAEGKTRSEPLETAVATMGSTRVDGGKSGCSAPTPRRSPSRRTKRR